MTAEFGSAVTDWLKRSAHPLGTLDPNAPLDDLEPFRAVVGDAVVVGFAEATRFASELFAVRFRLLRFLVEQLGFRALALEEDWRKGREIDEYLRTGVGDPRLLLDERSWRVWRTEQFVAALRWMRSYNERNPTDPIRLIGIDDHGHAPDAQHESSMAERLIAWQRQATDRIVYWGGTAHAAVHDPEASPDSVPRWRTTGAYLRDAFGTAYVSVGLTFDHGRLLWDVVPVSMVFAEVVFRTVGLERFAVDLRAPAPPVVRRWLATPTRTRVIGPRYEAAKDAEYSIAGGPFGAWFDAVVHNHDVTLLQSLE